MTDREAIETIKIAIAEVCEGQKWLEDHSDVIKEQINETD